MIERVHSDESFDAGRRTRDMGQLWFGYMTQRRMPDEQCSFCPQVVVSDCTK
jgi:hypothetical protein